MSPPPITEAAPGFVALGPKAQRWLALDGMRGSLTIVVVMFHVGMCYVPLFPWGFHEGNSVGIALFMLLLSIFVMVSFLTISGFAARAQLLGGGTASFLRDRALRIGLPFVLLLPVVRWLLTLIFEWGDRVMRQTDPAHGMTGGGHLAVFPLGHLWFLYMLMIFYVAALLLRRPLAGLGGIADRLMALAVRTRLVSLAAALPLAFTVLMSRTSFQPWIGIATPGPIPSMVALVGYGSVFALGWLLHRQQQLLLPMLARDWYWHAPMGAILYVVYVAVLFGTDTPYALMHWPQRLPIALIFAVTTTGLAIGILSLFLRFLQSPPAWMRYFAQTSYWVYLVHLPIALALPVAIRSLALPPIVKLLLVTAVAYALMLLAFELFVRNTFIGVWLNGARKKKPAPGVPAAAAVAAPSVR